MLIPTFYTELSQIKKQQNFKNRQRIKLRNQRKPNTNDNRCKFIVVHRNEN